MEIALSTHTKVARFVEERERVSKLDAIVALMRRKSLGQVLVILVTVSNQEEAIQIGEGMVNARLAACANIITGIRFDISLEGKSCQSTGSSPYIEIYQTSLSCTRKSDQGATYISRLLKSSHYRLRKDSTNIWGGYVTRPTTNRQGKCF